MFVDSHCHLNYKGLVEDQESVLARARAAGVSKMLNISTRASEWDAVIATAERESDVRVINRAVYRSNGNPTYVDADRHAHLWVVDVVESPDRPKPRPLTSGDYDERGAQWAPDGSSLYFTSDRRPESYYEPNDADIYRVPVSGGEITRVASIDGGIGSLAIAPDGEGEGP